MRQFGSGADAEIGVDARVDTLTTRLNASVLQLTASTTDATPTELLRVDNGGRMTLADATAHGFSILITGTQVSGGAVVASQLYRIEGIGTRGTGAGTVAIGSGEQLRLDPIGAQPFGTPAVDADTSNGAVRFKVTGLAATNITWNATLIWA
ncbi:MAG: hypothetical protein EBS05_10125 [Proteobacteria bacterium]|nr:hypothetical protein [Pseudomonadota bacterium]